MSGLKLNQSDEYASYIYSFYFCTTTIMTVGYGDLSPKNIREIVFIIFIEIFGKSKLIQE
jgi:hypothetical protein